LYIIYLFVVNKKRPRSENFNTRKTKQVFVINKTNIKKKDMSPKNKLSNLQNTWKIKAKNRMENMEKNIINEEDRFNSFTPGNFGNFKS
jgi:hypothetical protein